MDKIKRVVIWWIIILILTTISLVTLGVLIDKGRIEDTQQNTCFSGCNNIFRMDNQAGKRLECIKEFCKDDINLINTDQGAIE